MALRLTGTSLQSPGAAAPALSVSAEALAARARTELARGEIDRYAALFSEAQALEDPQRRYQARLALLEAALLATGQASETGAKKIFAAAADAALTVLEEAASEPIVLNLAGIALYELWSLDAAHALFAAARRLDPQLGDAARNLDQVARRKRAAGRPTRPLHAAVPGLARRAQAVARQARPAAGLTLSLAMIVRDEEQMLPRCLQAAAPAVDEIVIVDTGSTDDTVNIARSFGARVIDFPWTGSFSEARNASFEAVTGDWVMYLDADEILVADDIPQLRALLGRTWREAFYVVETSYTGEAGDGGAVVNDALRIFRNRPAYRFKDRLHEQIQHTLPTYVPGRIEHTPVRVTHYGYLGSVREAKAKSERNVELLRRQAAESAPSPFLHFNLGSEYVAAGDPGMGVQELQRARTLLTQEGSLVDREFGPPLMNRLVLALRQCDRLAEARQAAAEGLALFPELTDLVLAQARIAQALGEVDEALRLYERCIEMGDAPAGHAASVGAGTYLPRLALAELHLQLGNPAAARAALEWCVENHPEFLAVAGPYVTALLHDGMPAADALAELDRLGALPAVARLAVADALRQAGASDAAEQEYQVALAGGAAPGRIRTALGELRLGRGAWDEAAEAVAPVPADDPYAALAARIELCAVIGRTDDATVTAALDRARAAGLPAAEVEVFEAWARIGAGAEAPEGLPVAGVPMLAVVLETLLQAGDGERFTALLAALRRSRLAPREQAELLAEMYLAHGLLAPAAQEWMAVCSDAPDARALIGLARVSERHGLLEDAATFATGALELEPNSPAAKALLARLPAAPAVPA